MKKLIQICLLLCFVSSAMGQEKPVYKAFHVYDWNDLQQQGQLSGGEIISMDGMSVLKVENTNNNAPLEISLLTITNQSVIKKIDFVSLEMKYENVGELVSNRWGGMQFNNSGGLVLSIQRWPLALGGDETTNESWFNFWDTSNWKRQDYGVDHWEDFKGPIKELKLVLSLSGTGTVYLRPIKLTGIAASWWSPQQSALMGSIGGAFIGCLGALIGILAGIGKARRFVLTSAASLIVVGILLVIAGILAVAMKQPYAVWYPLVLAGGILTFALGVNLHSLKRRYEDLEIRRMTSMDASGS
jgi:hypothetical protein